MEGEIDMLTQILATGIPIWAVLVALGLFLSYKLAKSWTARGKDENAT